MSKSKNIDKNNYIGHESKTINEGKYLIKICIMHQNLYVTILHNIKIKMKAEKNTCGQ